MDPVEFAERALLGFLLYQPGVLADPYPPLSLVADDFGAVEHQRIYRALQHLVQARQPERRSGTQPVPTEVAAGERFPYGGESYSNLQYTVDTEGRLVRRGDVEIATLTELARERMEQRYQVPGVDAVAVLEHLHAEPDDAEHPVTGEYLYTLLSTAPPLDLERPRPDLSYADIVLDGSIRRRVRAAGLRVTDAFTPDRPLQAGLQKVDDAVAELRTLARRWHPHATNTDPTLHASPGLVTMSEPIADTDVAAVRAAVEQLPEPDEVTDEDLAAAGVTPEQYWRLVEAGEDASGDAGRGESGAWPTVPDEADVRAAERQLVGHALRNPTLMGTVFARLGGQDFSSAAAAVTFHGLGVLAAADHAALAAGSPRPVIDPATVAAAQQDKGTGLSPEVLQSCRAAASSPDAADPRGCVDVVLRGHMGRASAAAARVAADTGTLLGEQLRAAVERAGHQFHRVGTIVERWQTLPHPAPEAPEPVPTPVRDQATRALLDRVQHRGEVLRSRHATGAGGDAAATPHPAAPDPAAGPELGAEGEGVE